MKAKIAEKFFCNNCNALHATWVGRCNSCGSWNSIEAIANSSLLVHNATFEVPGSLADVALLDTARISTGSSEFDRALCGGIVPGSTVLVGGEPGIGKSTLAVQVATFIARGDRPVLYVSAEESGEQVAARSNRLQLDSTGVDFVHSADLAVVLAAMGSYKLIVVDSIQALSDPELGGLVGSVSQVRHCSQALNAGSKAKKTAVLILSHVTKDGSLAGPKLLEHLVDAVFVIDGDRSGDSRVIRCQKNRFGKVSEVGYFKMEGLGLADEPDPGAEQLADRLAGAPGSVVTAARDGNRVRLVEVQALAVANPRDVPRRQFLGLSSQRCAVIIGLVEHFANLRLDRFDIFMSVAGGLNSDDPGLDLAIAAAIVSAVLAKPVPESVSLFGELGLTGEVRKVKGDQDRIDELRRHGFTSFIVPARTAEKACVTGEKSTRTLSEALEIAGLKRSVNS